ncbi:hypothetical protein AB1N83_011746 [Pleurotus pulmonarius]
MDAARPCQTAAMSNAAGGKLATSKPRIRTVSRAQLDSNIYPAIKCLLEPCYDPLRRFWTNICAFGRLLRAQYELRINVRQFERYAMLHDPGRRSAFRRPLHHGTGFTLTHTLDSFVSGP